ncbi:hypothetical protein BJP40_10810 [Streptomyces sp. CC53]|nr:hypothetical protein BJP40_10810 [Streptomyces sp. CC53]
MVWDEWERAKGEAASRMRLNQMASQGGSTVDGADLVVRDQVLGGLGDLARQLRERVARDGDHARAATAGAATELTADGVDMGSALYAVHDAWITKLSTLMDACAHISNHLDYSRSAHAEDEQKIVTDFSVSRVWDAIK